MTIPLSAAGELVLDGKNIETYYQVKIDGVDRTSKVLSYSYGFNRQFGAAQAIIVLNNVDGEFSPGGANVIEYNDTLEIIEGFQVSGSPESWSKFYGLVRQRPVRNNQGDNTIQLTALDYICRLEDLEIDATYESSSKVAVVDEELTGNSIAGFANMADLWTIANDNIADEPTPILRIENRENLLVQPRVDDYDIDYETGQITMNPINKNTHKVLLTYSHYTEGLFIEDIIESILTALDGYGNAVFTTATNLTTNYTDERGGSTDTLTPNYVTQTIDGTDYPAGQVWFLTYNNVSTTLVAGDFTVPGATISSLSQRYGRIILNTAISTSATVTYNQNYTFKTLQCVDTLTEVMTKDGWKKYNELKVGEDILTFNMETHKSEWNKVEKINVYPYKGKLISLKSRGFNALVTPGHKWPVCNSYQAYTIKKELPKVDLIETRKLTSDKLILSGAESELPIRKVYSDNLVKLVAWYITEGCFYKYKYKKLGKRKSLNRIGVTTITQSLKKGNNCLEIENILKGLKVCFKKRQRKDSLILDFIITGKMVNELEEIVPNKKLNIDFICKLTKSQGEIFLETLIKGDGSYLNQDRSNVFYSTDKDNIAMFQLLCSLMGYKTSIFTDDRREVTILGKKFNKIKKCYALKMLKSKYKKVDRLKMGEVEYDGVVWCPTVKNKTWLMRRNGAICFTGNSSGIEVSKVSFSFKDTRSRFDAIVQLRKLTAPNYLLRTKGTNKIWSEFLNQKFTEDYTLKLMSSLSYLDDQDIYTRVKLFGKNSNPTNLVTRGASMKADATEYEGYAHAQVLGYFSGYDESSSILYDITRVAETRYTDFTNWTLGGSMTRATTGYKTSPNCLYINGGSSGFALSPEITVNSGAELVVISGLIKWSNTSGAGRATVWEYVDPYTSLEKAYCGIRLKEYDTNHTLIRTTHQMVVGEGISQWQRLEHRFDLHSSTSYVRAEFMARQGLPGYSQGTSNAAVNLSGLGAAKLNVNIDGAGAQEISLTPANLTSSWKIAEEIQTKLRAVGTGGYAEATCEFIGSDISSLFVTYSVQQWGTGTYFTNSYLIKSGTGGTSSSVVVTNAASDNVADDLQLGFGNGGPEVPGEDGFDTITAYCDNVAIIQGKDPVTSQPYEDGGAEVIFNARPYDQSELRIREDDTHPVTVYINKVPIKNQRHQIVAEKVRVIEKVTTTETSGK